MPIKNFSCKIAQEMVCLTKSTWGHCENHIFLTHFRWHAMFVVTFRRQRPGLVKAVSFRQVSWSDEVTRLIRALWKSPIPCQFPLSAMFVIVSFGCPSRWPWLGLLWTGWWNYIPNPFQVKNLWKCSGHTFSHQIHPGHCNNHVVCFGCPKLSNPCLFQKGFKKSHA